MEENKNQNSLNNDSREIKKINKIDNDDKKFVTDTNKVIFETSSSNESNINKAVQTNNIQENKTIEERKNINNELKIKTESPIQNNEDIKGQNQTKTNVISQEIAIKKIEDKDSTNIEIKKNENTSDLKKLSKEKNIETDESLLKPSLQIKDKELDNSEQNKRNITTANNDSNKITKENIVPPSNKVKTKPVKELPIEKKPFNEFINEHLIPEIRNEFKLKGKEINKINLQKTNRPIAEDICWVIFCEVKDTCNFWLSFEKDDITSLKSFSLCKNYEKPSIIESFLIDEKKITLKLIISRVLQRLNGQKLMGAN